MMINRIGEYLNSSSSRSKVVAESPPQSQEEPDAELLPWLDQFVRTQPGLALAGALAAGMVVAWFIKRR